MQALAGKDYPIVSNRQHIRIWISDMLLTVRERFATVGGPPLAYYPWWTREPSYPITQS